MNIFILILNICIPMIMMYVGVLYKYNSNNKIDKILDLIMPVAMIFSGISDDKKSEIDNNNNSIILFNKKISFVWIISGFITLIITIFGLFINKVNITNISIALLEMEAVTVIGVFVTIQFWMKNKFDKKYN